MKRILIACKTLENELNKVLEKYPEQTDIRWIESGLHNVPKKLTARLQEELDKCTDCDEVLLVMGICGNSVVGLKTGDFTMIIPRVDDCISLLIGSMKERQSYKATYFMTEGWLAGERNIWKEYEYCTERFGEETGKLVFDEMFRNYKNVALLDTGCFDFEKAQAETKQIADKLNLDYKSIPGTLSYMDEFLRDNHSAERFIIIPPHSTVTDEDCML